ncbi:hypothetical protein [Streptomyces sp. NPDC048057]|uniref:hypothetical protein n=1 Tax=Streptomyces sp. NPDC048057 TaxID=3155628 RepID=UPI0033F30EB2
MAPRLACWALPLGPRNGFRSPAASLLEPLSALADWAVRHEAEITEARSRHGDEAQKV